MFSRLCRILLSNTAIAEDCSWVCPSRAAAWARRLSASISFSRRMIPSTLAAAAFSICFRKSPAAR